MTRAIKFRAWLKYQKRIVDWEGKDGALHYIQKMLQDKDVILMQYTGKHDKNGIEIYEGDLLKHDLWGVSEIIWEDGGFRGVDDKHDITLADHQLQRSRVIGNIYENPELLTPKDNQD